MDFLSIFDEQEFGLVVDGLTWLLFIAWIVWFVVLLVKALIQNPLFVKYGNKRGRDKRVTAFFFFTLIVLISLGRIIFNYLGGFRL